MSVALCEFAFSTPAQAVQVLRKGNEVEPETLDPHKAQGISAANILRDLYEGLTGEAPDGSVVPGAAERWEVADEGRSYTFFLREGARWSNGDPLTAEDYAAGLRRSADPRTGSKYSQLLLPIENADAVTSGRLPPEALGVGALDAHRLQIRLRAPAPHFPGLLTHHATFPVHRPSLAAHGERFARPGLLVGNGAYRLDQWVMQSHIALVRNTEYWDAAQVAVDRVVYYPTENAAAELKRYRAGELDWTGTVPQNQMPWVRQNLGAELHATPYLGIYYYGFNLTRAPFRDNPKLRRALALAVDREILAGKIAAAGETPAYGWVPPGTAGYAPVIAPWASWPAERRLAEARRLYAEAGYSAERPLEVEIRYNTHADHKKIAVVVAYMWQQALGVRTRLINEEWKVFLQSRRFKRDTQVFRASWIGDYDDPSSFLELFRCGNGLNDTGYCNTAYDALLDAAAAQTDSGLRRARMQDAERLLLEDLPVLPMYFYVSRHLVKPYVRGWRANIMDHHYTKHFRLPPH